MFKKSLILKMKKLTLLNMEIRIPKLLQRMFSEEKLKRIHKSG